MRFRQEIQKDSDLTSGFDAGFGLDKMLQNLDSGQDQSRDRRSRKKGMERNGSHVVAPCGTVLFSVALFCFLPVSTQRLFGLSVNFPTNFSSKNDKNSQGFLFSSVF